MQKKTSVYVYNRMSRSTPAKQGKNRQKQGEKRQKRREIVKETIDTIFFT